MSNEQEFPSSMRDPRSTAHPPMIPGVRRPADLSAFVRDRTLVIERSVRRRRMFMLIVCLFGVFSIAVALLVTGLVEQSDRRVVHHRIAMYGLDNAARYLVSPLEMRQETERTDLRVALGLTRVGGARPLLARRVLSFLEARGQD